MVRHLEPTASPAADTGIGPHLLLPTYLSKHGRIDGLILELRSKSVLHQIDDSDELAHVDAEISQWWNAVQDLVYTIDSELAFNPQFAQKPRSSVQLNPAHKLLLVVQKHELIILLYRPVITSGNNTSSIEAAMQKCIGVSKEIITNVYRHLSSDMEAEGNTQSNIKTHLV